MRSTLRDCYGCPLSFLRLREQNASKICWGPATAYTTFLTNRLDLARNLYRKDLYAHYGCVNAIEFSNEGCWLISGGDDRRVLLWNLESTMSGKCKPTPMKEEHTSNIFCLGFDSLNSKIFSAGNDEQVIVHDVKTGETVNVFMHEEAIYGVSVDPYRDSVFASAGEDGQILIFDIRAPASEDPLLLAHSYNAFHAVQFHPVEPTFVVTANSKEGVVLWDVRKPRVPFVKYGEKRCSESSMCARFNSNGTQIIALRRRMHPVLFNTQSSAPVCEFDADHYYNSCTMKSCCFAGSTDQFVLSGSDDFNLYMWKIPDPHSEVNFIPDAHLILRGHRSIVNQVRFNKHNLTIASSGVEKIVKLWSPVAVPGSYGTLVDAKSDSYMTRKVYTHEDYIGLVLDSGQIVSHDYSHGSTDEDPKMMAFFDSLVQREVEGWTTNTDLSDDDLDATSNPTHSSSSLPSSQSEDTDSDSAWVSPGLSSSSLRRRRLAPAHRAHEPVVDAGEQRDLPPSGGRPKPGHGSEWILHLIAKKRAQLKAAKKNRRSVRRKQKSKARQFIRCFTSSRQYLYRPDNNRASASHCTNRAAPPDLLRRRHAVAPYTMISLGDLGDSDSDSDDDSDEEGGGTTTSVTPTSTVTQLPPPPPPSSRGIASVLELTSRPSSEGDLATDTPSSHPLRQPLPRPVENSYAIRLWSSDSSLSDYEESTKGNEVSELGEEDTTSSRMAAPRPRNSPAEDGLLDTNRPSSNAPENQVKGATSVMNSFHYDSSAISSLHSVRTNGSNSISAAHAGVVMGGTAANCNGVESASLNLGLRNAVDSPLVDFIDEVSSNSRVDPLRNAVPISGLSTDESGALVFETSPGRPSSESATSLGLLNRVDFKSSRERNITTNNNACNNTRYISGGLSVNPALNPAALEGSTTRTVHRRSDSSSSSSMRKSARGQRSSSELSSRVLSAKRNPHHRQSDRASSTRAREEDDKPSPSSGGFANGGGATPGLLPITSKEREMASPSCYGNGENASDGGASATTPDSGIFVGDRGPKAADGSSSSESDRRKGPVDSRPTFKKKKIPEFRLKSYRKRLRGGASDDEVKNDFK